MPTARAARRAGGPAAGRARRTVVVTVLLALLTVCCPSAYADGTAAPSVHGGSPAAALPAPDGSPAPGVTVPVAASPAPASAGGGAGAADLPALPPGPDRDHDPAGARPGAPNPSGTGTSESSGGAHSVPSAPRMGGVRADDAQPAVRTAPPYGAREVRDQPVPLPLGGLPGENGPVGPPRHRAAGPDEAFRPGLVRAGAAHQDRAPPASAAD